MGDNGTAGESSVPVAGGPREGHVLEASVRVPFLVAARWSRAGLGVDALVHVVDSFPTAAEIAGVDLDDGIVRDGFSLVPLLADPTDPGRHRCCSARSSVRTGPDVAVVHRPRPPYKLVGETGLPDALYDLRTNPWSEGHNLVAAGPLSVEARSAFVRLRAEADAILADLGVEP